jgi:multiple sugar transport system ATP-binding protein
LAKVILDRLTKHFGSVVAVDSLYLEIKDEEFLVLVGPSGCGKTTTLRMIAGLERPTSGEVYFGDKPVSHLPPERRDIAMVFQSYALYPHMNVFENIGFALKMMGVPKEEIRRRVGWAAGLLGMEELLDRKPKELSGGQRQRVALGRAIVREPAAYLLDEPLSNLDAKLRVMMRGELKKLHADLGGTFIYVTHDQAEALTMANRIAIMDAGRLQQCGTPEEVYERPQNLFVAGFIGSPPMNFIAGELTRCDGELRFGFEGTGYRLPGQAVRKLEEHGEREIVMGVRPESVKVSLDGEGIDSTIYIEEPMGADLFLTLIIGDTRLTSRTPPDERLKGGVKVKVNFDQRRLHFFDAESRQRIIIEETLHGGDSLSC